MAKRIGLVKATVVAGDYMGPNKKLLVAVGDNRKAWLEKVASLVDNGSITEVIKTVIDLNSIEDPETFAVKVEKHRLKMQLDEIEREEKAIAERKAQLVESLQNRPLRVNEAK